MDIDITKLGDGHDYEGGDNGDYHGQQESGNEGGGQEGNNSTLPLLSRSAKFRPRLW